MAGPHPGTRDTTKGQECRECREEIDCGMLVSMHMLISPMVLHVCIPLLVKSRDTNNCEVGYVHDGKPPWKRSHGYRESRVYISRP